jgi:hypothetical protein
MMLISTDLRAQDAAPNHDEALGQFLDGGDTGISLTLHPKHFGDARVSINVMSAGLENLLEVMGQQAGMSIILAPSLRTSSHFPETRFQCFPAPIITMRVDADFDTVVGSIAEAENLDFLVKAGTSGSEPVIYMGPKSELQAAFGLAGQAVVGNVLGDDHFQELSLTALPESGSIGHAIQAPAREDSMRRGGLARRRETTMARQVTEVFTLSDTEEFIFSEVAGNISPIDSQTKEILQILQDHKEQVKLLALTLLEKQVLSAVEIYDALNPQG